jgi:hypothetical protein
LLAIGLSLVAHFMVCILAGLSFFVLHHAMVSKTRAKVNIMFLAIGLSPVIEIHVLVFNISMRKMSWP